MKVASGREAVTAASKWLGTAYCWGGGHAGPVPVGTCVDCSGLVNQVFGISGNTGTQIQLGQAISGVANAQPGDLVFFGPLAPGEPYHVGIYTGGGMMVNAPHTGASVRFDNVSSFGTVDGVRRLVPSGGDAQVLTPGTVQFSYAQLEAVWIQAGGNAQYAPMAAAVAMAESQGQANASNTNSNGSIDRGLWQINSSNGAGSSFDVMTNARAAVALSNGGVNWRPWCTAYSDGACGSKGGAYLGQGSPYQTYLRQGVAPDYSAPINATNAAANQQAVTTGFSVGSILDCVSNPENCIADQTTQMSAGVIKAIVHSILNPIIQPIAGLMGITAGGVLMIGGVWVLVSGTRTGQAVNKVAFSGAALAAGQPELAAAGSVGGGLQGMGRTQVAAQRGATHQQQLQQTATLRHEQRVEAMSTQQLLNIQAEAYREYLRRTRPVRGRPRGGTPSSGQPAITAQSRGA